MPRAFSRTALRAGAALGLVLGLAVPATGQTSVIYNSQGFDTGYTPNFLFPQGGFTNFLPSVTAGMIQTSTALSGTQAFQAVASQMQPNPTFAGGNFWWRAENYDTTPTRYLQVSFAGRLSVPQNLIEMPFGGVFLEGKNAAGGQQLITQVLLNNFGGVSVSTTAALGEGTSQTISTADNLFAKGSWHELFTEIDFQNQTFRVYRAGDPTPLQFQGPNGLISDLSFAYTESPIVTMFEAGMVAFNFNFGGGSELAPGGSFYVDDFQVSRSATSLAPVPEPSLMLAVGAVGLAGWRVYRRRKAAVA